MPSFVLLKQNTTLTLVPVAVKNYSPNYLRFQLIENMAKYPQCYFVSLQ